MTSQPPLLMLSSGARPRYLEDIARALALPAGGQIQFRYETEIVANGVLSHLQQYGLIGHTCYLTYLDNRTPGKIEIVPVREARVLEANLRGSSVIIKMEVARYIGAKEKTAFDKIVDTLKNGTQDQMVTWKPDHAAHPDNPFNGYWVNFVNSPLVDNQLVEHDPIRESHLVEFERSVKRLREHSDFSQPSSRFFFNVISLRDSSRKVCNLKNGGWQLSPGRQYTITIYHFFPEEGPLTQRQTHWIGCRASGEALSILGSGVLRADSEYDSKSVDIQTMGTVRDTQNALTIYRTTNPSDQNASTAELMFNVEVKADWFRNSIQALFIGVFVALPALVAVYPDVSSWKSALILAGGLLAGFASIFKFSKSV